MTVEEGKHRKFYDVHMEQEKSGNTYWVHAISGRIDESSVPRPLGAKGSDARGLSREQAEALVASVVHKKTHQSPAYTVIETNGKVVSIAPSVKTVKAQTTAITLPSHTLFDEVDSDRHRDALIANDNWWMEVKSDGHRKRVIIDHGKVSSVSRQNNDRGLSARVTKYLGEKFPDSFVVLDSEMVAEDDQLVVFDVLQIDNHEIWREKLPARVHWRDSTFGKSGPVVATVTAKTRQAKRNLIESAWALGCEGTVFKRIDAAYQGGRTEVWKKYKFWNFAYAVVLPPLDKDDDPDKESVPIGMFDERTPLLRRSKPRDYAVYPQGNTMRKMASVSTRGKFVPPVGSVILVRYLYVKAKDGSTYETTMQSMADVPVDSCTIDKVYYKGTPRTVPFE
jgi:hypothetical protein